MRKAKKAKASPRRTTKKRPTLSILEAMRRLENSPSEETLDQYVVPRAEIPRGRDYSWVRVALLGMPVGIKELQQTTKGWKPVPLKRHRKRFPQSESLRHIVVGGLQLYERKARVGLTDANLAAMKMVEDHPASKSGDAGGGVFIFSESFNVAGDYPRAHSSAESIAVDVKIPVWLSAHLQDTASALKMTNEDYIQRRVMLHLEGRIAGLMLPHGQAFELREIYLNEGQRNA